MVHHAVPGRMRFALWQLLVFLERWLSGNKAQRLGGEGTADTWDPEHSEARSG